MGGGVTDTDLWVLWMVISGRAPGAGGGFNILWGLGFMCMVRGAVVGVAVTDAETGALAVVGFAAASRAFIALFCSFLSFFRSFFSSESNSTSL